MKLKEIEIPFEDPKFTNKHLDLFADNLFKKINEIVKEKEQLVFDLSSLEWIAHEELVFLSSIFVFLKNNSFNFFIKFRKVEDDQTKITIKEAAVIIYLWRRWKIQSFVEKNEKGLTPFEIFFDIDDNYVSFLIEKFKLDGELSRIYDWYKITPFVAFKTGNENISQETIINDINEIYQIEKNIKDILSEYQSETPFINKSLGFLITKELYENAIDHAYINKSQQFKECYFGVSLKNKYDETKFDKKTIQKIAEKYFNEESIPKTSNFFKQGVHFRNFSFLQFTFIDFGIGIPKTLADNYSKKIEEDKSFINETFCLEHVNQNIDTRILEYAFNFSSSRYEIDPFLCDSKDSISRGLYDVIVIVKRYKGLIIARSNYGKLIFDFSNENKSIKDCVEYFSEKNLFFRGTIITIYIPENLVGISQYSIKPVSFHGEFKEVKCEYISVLEVQKKVIKKYERNFSSEEIRKRIYNDTFYELKNYFNSYIRNVKKVIFLDFAGCWDTDRKNKKIIQWLAQTYIINETNNLIIINPPDEEQLNLINNIIIERSEYSKFHYHPLPCIYNIYDEGPSEKKKIFWIGINKKEDIEILNKALTFDLFSFSKTDFEDPEEVPGNLYSYDEFGNLTRNCSYLSKLAIENLIEQNTLNNKEEIYLSAGNYYQDSYISFLETLQDDQYVNFLCSHLYEEIKKDIRSGDFNKIISITLSSQLIAKGLSEKFKNEGISQIRLSNYNTFEDERPFSLIKPNENFVLVCDVISTGFLIKKLKDALLKKGANLIAVFALVDTRIHDKGENIKNCLFDELKNIKIIKLHDKKIKKYTKKPNDNRIIVRINPITNTTNTLSTEKSEQDTILFINSSDLFKEIDKPEEFLRIGHIYHNDVEHTYYIETKRLFSTDTGNKVLKTIFSRLLYAEGYNIENDSKERSIAIIRDIEIKINSLNTHFVKSKELLALQRSLSKFKSSFSQSDLPLFNEHIEYVFFPTYSGIEESNLKKIRKEVFNQEDIKIFPLARVNTPKGWRLTFPPKFLNENTKDKVVLLLDDGSCTGDTLSQMIVNICYLQVKRIIILSIFARIEDFQRELYSRIKEVKVKRINSFFDKIDLPETENLQDSLLIPINIYFGTHLHIPIYSNSHTNYFEKERIELSKYKGIANLPSHVLDYINNRLNELTLIHSDELSNDIYPSYLPRDLHTNIIPVIELFEYRDLIGKISAYRFFNQYFEYFNNEETKLSKIEFSKRYELLIAVLIHEPYLIQSIKDLLPDVYTKLNQFISNLIINGNPIISGLFYKWQIKSLVKFFNQMNLSEILEDNQTLDNLAKLISFLENDIDALNYFAFSLFTEIPHFKEHSTSKPFGKATYNRINELYDEYRDRFSKPAKRMLEKLLSYCNTNPFLDEKEGIKYHAEQLRKLYQNEEVNGIIHESVEKDLNYIDSDLQDIQVENDLNKVKNIVEKWPKVKDTLEFIVKHVRGLEEVLIKYDNAKIWNHIIKNDFSLLNHIGIIDDIIYNGTIIENIDSLDKRIKDIDEKVIGSKSISRSFLKNYKVDLLDVWKSVFDTQFVANNNLIINYEGMQHAYFHIHKHIVKEIIFDEIKTNIQKHADKSFSSTISWKEMNKNFELLLINRKSLSSIEKDEGTRRGLEKIRELSSSLDYELVINNDNINEFEMKIIFINQT